MTPDESTLTPPMRPELGALAEWLRMSGRMPHLDYERLLLQVVAIAERATLLCGDQADVETIAHACDAVQTHLGAAVRDQDPAALALLLERLLPLARAVGYNPIHLERIGGRLHIVHVCALRWASCCLHVVSSAPCIAAMTAAAR